MMAPVGRSAIGPIRGNIMTLRKISASLVALGGAAILTLALEARAGGDKVAFPTNYDKGVLYATIDRADNKQYRELYTSQAAIDAVKKGQPTPSGTVITLVQYAAKLDAGGNPEKDANGRFIKSNLIGYTVMEKRTGWGAEYPNDIRNGEWEYQAFKADKSVNTAAKLENCFKCHKPLGDAKDYLFTIDRLKAAR
jgi:hypothetical protein